MANQVEIVVTGRNQSGPAMDSARRQASGLGEAVKKVGIEAQGIITAQMFQQVAAAAQRFLGQARAASSNLGESINAVNVAFRGASAGIHELGETAATSMGLSQNAFNAAAVRFSAFAEAVAGQGGDVTKTIRDITQRSSDFASVMNLDVNEAMRVFQSGLAGESEPLRRYGIDVSAAATQTFAYANGLAAAGEQLTEAQKIQARYGLIMQQTEQMAGDFANTSDALANSQRILAAEMENAQAIVGSLMVPALEALNALLIPLVQAFSDAPKPIQVVIGSLVLLGAAALTVTSRIAPMVIAMQAVGISAGTLAAKVRLAALSVASLGLAVVAAGVGIIAWGTSARHTSENIAGLTEDIERFVRTGEQTASLRRHFGEGAEGVEEFADKLDVATAGFFNWSDSLNRTFDVISKAKSAFKDLDTATADLVDQGHDADEILQQLVDTYDLSAEQVEKLRGVLPKYTEAAERAGERTDDLADSTRDQIVALEDLEDALKAQADPMFALIKAQQNLAEKQDAYTDAVKRFGRASPQAEDALLALAEAGVDVASASARAGGAFDGRLTPAMRAALSAAGLTEQQIRAVEQAAERARQKLEQFEGNYRANVHTTFTSSGRPPAGGARPNFAVAHGGVIGGIGAQPMQGGALGLVGEQGPELVRLPVGSTVIPSGQSQAILNGGGGGRVTLEVVAVGSGDDLMDAIVRRLSFRVRTQAAGSVDTLLGAAR